jgi:hypothetical protein
MNPTVASAVYLNRAKAADCLTWRTVYMLGLMCAAAVDRGAIVAFVGKGEGANWPDVRYWGGWRNSSRAVRPPQRS